MLKPKQSGKQPIGIVRRLRVKRQVKILRGIPKEDFFFLTYFCWFSLSNAKRLKIKSFLEVNLVSLTLRVHTDF